MIRTTMAVSVTALALSLLPGCAGMDSQSVQQAVQAASQIYGGQAALSESEIVAGLREALAQGTTSAINTLGRTNGFWGNAAVRIPLPENLAKVESALRQAGLSSKVDEFQVTLNRAAEQAVPQVADIFGNAVREMTLEDARGILSGGQDAATQYFRRTSEQAISAKFLPIVQNVTGDVGLTQKYKSLTASYGPLLKMAGVEATDLDAYVTAKAVDGLFYMVAAEEARIRRDPRARTSELLRKVFGGV